MLVPGKLGCTSILTSILPRNKYADTINCIPINPDTNNLDGNDFLENIELLIHYIKKKRRKKVKK
jgi:hypothetical protein